MGCRNAEYNPSKFPAVVMRIREPKTTALIFSKGKMVITGAKSEHGAMQAGKIFEKAFLYIGNYYVYLLAMFTIIYIGEMIEWLCKGCKLGAE